MAVLPVWLTGGLSIFMAEDLAFDEQQLGFAVAGFFLSSAAASVPGGRLAERFGARRSIPLLASVSAVILAAISTAQSWLVVSGLLIIGGAANGMLHPSVNLALARQVTGRRALAFGIKQSAIPAATLIAGVAVPSIASTLGWRSAFQAAALLSLCMAVLSAVVIRDSAAAESGRPVKLTMPMFYLIVLTVAAGFGAAAGNAMAAFLVPSSVEAGIEPNTAGIILVVGSISCIITRVWIGWRADSRRGGHLRVVAYQLLIGAVGFALLAWSAAPTTVVFIGAILGFAAGWGWAGLFNFDIVERNPDAPATATGVIAVGIFGGAVFGPSLFGTIVVATSYTAAWWATSFLGLSGAVLTFVARRRLMVIGRRRS